MYDIIYIGGGLNYAGAIMAAKKGLKVALVEKDLKQLGGVCLHKGCIPSKMLLHYAKIAHQSQNDIFEGSLKLNMKTLVAKKDKLISSATKAVRAQCRDIELIEGEGIIKKAHKVSVNDKVYEANILLLVLVLPLIYLMV
jgi:dihydrolipoamide dehydrogenase